MTIRQRIARFFLRDLFAGLAMQAQMSKPLSTEDLRRMADRHPGCEVGRVFAVKAYQMADNMLEVRKAQRKAKSHGK